MKPKPPSAVIEAAHAEHLTSLPFEDTADFADADRGFIGALTPCVVKAADGRVVWDNDAYGFLAGDAPTSVHPSLWRQSTLAAKQGLYEVVEGIYQVRGLDLSNISFIEGDTGIIVIDPLVSTETAAAALALYRAHRGDRPVVAVIYTHSHVDHFGGVLGVTTQADVDAGKVAILAPEGFTEHAVQENVYAGTAMARRAGYMYGAVLERGPQGQVGCGLGQTPSTGEVAIIVPTIDITTTGEKHTIDGIEIEFQMAPGTEAPAEMHFYFPKFRALCMAENATHNLHNLLTLRGALVRDPHGWAGYLTEAIDTFADRADVVFASHHWPTWGQDNIVQFLSLQRDLYAYLHDQTLRQLNQGFTGIEIAEGFQMPPALHKAWHAHGYYGSVSHNVKAVYQRYMGWFDGNPARLWAHPPEAIGPRYVEAMGGIDRVVELARTATESGDYRWAVTLLDHAIFTDENHAGARELYADTLEQMAYGAECATWRNFFLSGSTELRDGNFGTPTQVSPTTLLAQLTPEQMFDVLAISVNGPRAWDLDIALDVTFADLGTNYRLTLRNGVLVYRQCPADESTATATIGLVTKLRLLAAAAGDFTSPGLETSGDPQALQSLLGALDQPDPSFNIITP
ncbi:alkyl sulfatase BDS1-like metallo-beta-lactamase superfamily hydrolase [Mycolicibacterium sp. BK556]|uniref:alkyl/aryl-sulfatase n=1 Tax=Mycobacteriaceae TaxID=1762 RepID=UPI00105FD224|nr:MULTISPECIES: alkyl sulfatase dimerization domain-containing protein [Mycobacteriaceae]MBB3601365.1 alkyl sulfatase BDS1-like metallo-beta-lactamase superfamily hydrolase [Mycolicibacterium sp. BK556]MBB3631117.1 alkyl sulfatase BDS1-like metallo-beta-lactamase superfamily hydrolase [Mycolicibacterium sp. BK607]MBB3749119.1 alkyl sulfatase BDS1-like metallo-beta-lactamase superfamily hydrolase [Mycolicibacterium sp. BK634]TDO14671.1 alkyl sulfatase BDS1-like metallo-beta-lactamase superfamil